MSIPSIPPKARRSSLLASEQDKRLAARIADAMTEYHPDTYTPGDVFDAAVARGLLSLAHEYKVSYGVALWVRGGCHQ